MRKYSRKTKHKGRYNRPGITVREHEKIIADYYELPKKKWYEVIIDRVKQWVERIKKRWEGKKKEKKKKRIRRFIRW